VFKYKDGKLAVVSTSWLVIFLSMIECYKCCSLSTYTLSLFQVSAPRSKACSGPCSAVHLTLEFECNLNFSHELCCHIVS